MTKTEAAIPENVLTWARLAGWNEQEIMSTTIEERLVRFTAIVLNESRAECIDVVARNGGSVEIEHAIRNLAKWGAYPRQTTPVSCQLYGHIVGCAECNNPAETELRDQIADQRAFVDTLTTANEGLRAEIQALDDENGKLREVVQDALNALVRIDASQGYPNNAKVIVRLRAALEAK